MIKHLNCSVFDTYAAVIAHQVNCMGVMGSGVAAQVRSKYPSAYKAYKDFCDEHKDNRIAMLGTAQFCPVAYHPDGRPRIFLVNLFGQFNYGRDTRKIYTNYDALRQSLRSLGDFVVKSDIYHTIAIPYKMGCDRGGGDWSGRVMPMIEEELGDFDVLICKYSGR